MIVLEEYTMLDIEEVMSRLGVSDSTIRRLVRDGKLRAYRIGRRLKFKQEDVDRFVEGQVVAPSAPEGAQEGKDNA